MVYLCSFFISKWVFMAAEPNIICMEAHEYEITSPVAGFEEGDVLDVTARFGDWHTYELKLEADTSTPGRKTVIVTDEDSGFTEAEILDETARIGDWHEHDLQFEPGQPSVETISTGRVRLTRDEFERIAEPVGATA